VSLPPLPLLPRRADETDALPSLSPVSIRIGDVEEAEAAAPVAVAVALAAVAGDGWYESGGSRAANEGNVAVPNGLDDDDADADADGRKLSDDMSEAESEDRNEEEAEDDELFATLGLGIDSAVRIDDDDDGGGRCGEAQRTGDKDSCWCCC
jgi:hypothetical protein